MSGPTYTYTPNVPQGPSAMNTTAVPIRTNFQAIQELLQVNHASWSDTYASTNLGMHNFITLPFSPPTTATTPATTDINMYAQATGSPNPAEIFVESFNGTVPIISQISNVQTGGGLLNGTSGTGWYQFKPTTTGNTACLIKWGTGSVTTINGNVFFPFPTGTGIPVYTSYTGYVKISPTSLPPSFNYGALGLYNNYGGSSTGSTSSTKGFNINCSVAGTFTFNWYAIGI